MQLLWLTNLFCFFFMVFWVPREGSNAVGYLFIWLFVRSFSSANTKLGWVQKMCISRVMKFISLKRYTAIFLVLIGTCCTTKQMFLKHQFLGISCVFALLCRFILINGDARTKPKQIISFRCKGKFERFQTAGVRIVSILLCWVFGLIRPSEEMF